MVVRMRRIGQLARERNAHRGPRTAQLQIGEQLREVERFARKPRQAHRGVEKRLPGRAGQLRRPVVAAREGQVELRFPADLDRGEQGLRLLVPARTLHLALRGFDGLRMKDIRRLGQRPREDQTLQPRVVDRRTRVGREREALGKSFRDVEHHIPVGLARLLVLLRVVAVLAALQKRRGGRGV